jgi:hypothetical protein
VDVDLLDDGSAVATWVELAQSSGQFRLRRIEPSGAKSAAVTITDLTDGNASGFPRMALSQRQLVFAWTERAGSNDADSKDALVVRTASARLPAMRQVVTN